MRSSYSIGKTQICMKNTRMRIFLDDLIDM